jgi:hypothetical protein
VFGAVLAVAVSSAVPATAKTGSDPAGTRKPAAATTASAFDQPELKVRTSSE